MVSVQQPSVRIESPYHQFKILLDTVMAAMMLLLLSPVMLLIALLICLDSRGPALYRQRRVGTNGKLFTIYKFRTMHVNAPCLSTEELQRRGVIPFTRLGPILRKTSLDELPQLFNILRGEMSFIGPRPALPTQTDVNQRRFELGIESIRPGLTGLAQVMGRDDLDTDTKVRYDAEYCQRMSLRTDLRIVVLTATTVLSARGNK